MASRNRSTNVDKFPSLHFVAVIVVVVVATACHKDHPWAAHLTQHLIY